MGVTLDVRNTSGHRRSCRRDALARLAGRVCAEEGVEGDVELSLLLCDDAFIRDLNRQFRQVDCATDVLSFGQEGVVRPGHKVLGDIVISMDTVGKRCKGEADVLRQEVRMLFCHGLLHLLGYDHANERDLRRMAARQAHYLGLSEDASWPATMPAHESAAAR